MMLTIVTATYNAVKSGRSRMLERCVRSVSSLGTPHEHLIIDGGSRDGTVELLRDIESKVESVKVKSESDNGIFDALNKGLAAAQGEWFMVVGDDDYISRPSELDRVMTKIDSLGADFVSAPIECSDGRAVCAAPRMLMCSMPQAHIGMLLKTELLRSLRGFDLRYRIAADYDMTFKLHLHGVHCCILDNPFVNFSVAGLSSTSIKEAEDEVADIASKHLGLNQKWRDRVRRIRIVPLSTCLKFMNHKSLFLRMSARHQLKRWCLWRAGLLDANGAPRF